MKESTISERGQVGIGTLIVFIAMVLVAAIAAGVLIETTGFLENRAEETGQESSRQVTDRVQVITETGTVDSGSIGEIDLNVERTPGAGDIDLSEATIKYVGPTGSADLTHTETLNPGTKNFGTSAVSGTGQTLSSDTDVLTVTMNLESGAAPMDVLDPGDTVELEIVTQHGGRTSVYLRVPQSLSGSTAVDL